MSASNFPRCFALTLKHEGGYVDNPADPGGATNLGVTIGTLSSWLGRPATKGEVRALTPETVSPIYRKNYWAAIRGDELPAGIDFAVYDFAVNSGPSRGAKALQRAIGADEDGVVGSDTLALVSSKPAEDVIRAVCTNRLSFLRGLRTWGTFGRGWETRVNGVLVQALGMSRTAPVPTPPVTTTPVPPIAKPAPGPVSTVDVPKPTVRQRIGNWLFEKTGLPWFG